MKFFLFFILLPLSFISQSKVDSLLFSLNKHPQRDTIRCNILIELIDAENDIDVWKKYCDELTLIAQENSIKNNGNRKLQTVFKKKLSFAYSNTGSFYIYRDSIDRGIYYYKKSLNLSKKIDDIHGVATAYHDIGIGYAKLGFLDSALFFLKNGFVIYAKEKNQSGIAYSLTDIGFIYKKLGNFNKAIDYNLKAVAIFKSLNHIKGTQRCYYAIAKIFQSQKEFKKALGYFYKCVDISIIEKNEEELCKNLNGIANCYFEINMIDSCIYYNNQSLALSHKINLPENTAGALFVSANVFYIQNKIDSAEFYLIKSFEISNSIGSKIGIAKSAALLAKIYLKNKQTKSAKHYALLSLNASNDLADPVLIIDAAKTLVVIYKAEKKHKKLIETLELININENIINVNENKNIALKKEFEYQNDLQKSEIKYLSNQKEIIELESKQKSILLYAIIASSFGIALLSYFLFTRYKKNKQIKYLNAQLIEANKTFNAEKRATESELKALKSQMNPHFIFNALNSIQEQFMYGDKFLANEQMSNFTYLTRQILTVSGKQKISISVEIDILTKYLELEKARFKEDFNFTITCSKAIDEDYHQLPPMLIQPFVENSMKHGLLHRQGAKQLSVFYDLSSNEDYIICTVIDNGVGRKKSAEIKAKNQASYQSFSIESIEQRLELLNPTLKLQNLIVYYDVLNDANEVVGTKVEISIPLV